jgi:hypothetical protein
MTERKKSGKKPASPGKQWPLLIVAGGILLVAVAAFVLWAGNRPEPNFTPQVSGAPAISVEPTQIDMGDVKLGTPVKADFLVKNLGDQPLKFTEDPYIELVEGC